MRIITVMDRHYRVLANDGNAARKALKAMDLFL